MVGSAFVCPNGQSGAISRDDSWTAQLIETRRSATKRAASAMAPRDDDLAHAAGYLAAMKHPDKRHCARGKFAIEASSSIELHFLRKLTCGVSQSKTTAFENRRRKTKANTDKDKCRNGSKVFSGMDSLPRLAVVTGTSFVATIREMGCYELDGSWPAIRSSPRCLKLLLGF